jgi:membrane protease YdiL (CAAX protease family)
LATHVPAFHPLANIPFHRFVNRSLLALALIGLWPLLRSVGARSCQDVGLVRPTGQWRRFTGGLLLGFVSLACLAMVVLVVGARQVNTGVSPGRVPGKLMSAALSAAVVAVLEEILFRGAIFGALRKTCRWRGALAISSAIYAIVHFFSKPQSPAEIHWTSGLAVLPAMLRGFANVEQVVPGFFNLALAGALLALAYQRTGNLYFSIGLHAGWIFWLKSYGFLTRDTAGVNPWFWGTSRLIDGWFALFVLAIALWVLWKMLPREEEKTASVPTE